MNQKWAASQASKDAKRRRPKLSKIYTNNGASWDYPLYGVHSLRVAGVSALLDAGIPLGVVASMTGHLTPVMTLYYYRAEQEQIRKLLSDAKVKLKDLPQIDAIMRNLDECETIDSMLLGTPQAFDRLKLSRKSRIWSLSLSGICPAASCDEGLPQEYWQSHGRDVPGSKCALCRFRIYGPAFLGGLVHEFNCLVFELEHFANRQAGLRTLARKSEAQGDEVTAATAHAEDDMLDRETQLHLKVLVRLHEMIQECVEKLNTRSDGNHKASALITQDPGQITAQFESAGQFAQLKKIIEDSDVFPTSRQVVPDHALRIMQEKLMQMCRANGAEMFLAGLPSEAAKRAALLFAAILEKSVPQRELLEGIFQGHIDFPELPKLTDMFQKSIVKSNHPPKSNVMAPALTIHKTKQISRK